MAIPVARVHLAMAHAALPALLPTPPKWKMMPLLPTPPCPCAVILPVISPPKPGRADAVERWDARKNGGKSPSNEPGRADAAERWDAHKTVIPAGITSSSGSGSGQTAPPDGKKNATSSSSCERWGSGKKSVTSSPSSSSGSNSASRASSGDKWGSNKRRPVTVSRASAAGRWDAHKVKPRPLQADGADVDDDDGQNSTGSSNGMELGMPQRAFYAGPSFMASPDPSMLPMPSSLLMVRVAA